MNNVLKIKTTRDFGSLITDSFSYVRRYFKSLGKSILYFVVPLFAVTAVFSYRYTSQVSGIAENANNPTAALDFGALFGPLMFSSIFGILTATALATVVFNHMKLASDEQTDSDNIQINDIWDRGKSDFGMVLLLNIGAFFASMIGILFFILPGIFIGIKLTLVTPVYVLENRSLSDSFSRSWNLITNHWWLTFGLVIVMSIFVSLMSYGITIPFTLVGVFTGFAGMEDPQSIFYAVNGMVSTLSYIFYTLFYLCLGLHYYNLAERKEGHGIGERIDQIAPEVG